MTDEEFEAAAKATCEFEDTMQVEGYGMTPENDNDIITA